MFLDSRWGLFGLLALGAAFGCSAEASESPMQEGAAGTSNMAQGGMGNAGSANGASGALGVAGSSGGQSAGGSSGAASMAGAGAGGDGNVAGAGTGGTAGAGGAAAGAEGPSGMSAGCAMTSDIEPDSPTLQTVTVAGVEAMYQNREYYLRLPSGYDSTQPHSLIMLGHGCGGSGTSVVPIHSEAGGAAIVVGLDSVEQCFATSGGMASPEIPYFDAVLADLSAKYCIDVGKVFVAGFSSGAWLSNLLGCARGDVIRGIGTMAGGLSDAIQGQCVGHIAAMMMADTEDSANPIMNIDEVSGIDEGSGAARALTAERNGCSTEAEAWDGEFPDCVQNTGCDPAHPVVWCETTGRGHSDQIPTSTVGLWRFWSSLP